MDYLKPVNDQSSVAGKPNPIDCQDHRIAIALGLVATAWTGLGMWVPSTWADEGATITATQRSWSELWHLLHNIDAVHGLYYATMKPWLDIAGVGSVAIRLPSLIAVGLVVALTYILSRAWLTTAPAAAAAVVCTVMPRSTWMAIEGRSWALATLLATLATLLLVRWLHRPRMPLLVCYALVAAIGVVLNIYAAFLIAAHGVALLLLRAPLRQLVRWFIAAALAAAAASPVVLASFGQRAQLGDRGGLSVTWWAMSIFARQFVLGDTPGDAPSTVPRALWSAAAVVLAVVCWTLVAIAAFTMARRRDGAAEPLLWLLPCVLVPPIAVLALGVAGINIYHPRYFALTTPAFAVCVAIGWSAISRRVLRRALALLLVVLTIPVYLSQRHVYAKAGYDWTAAAQQVAETTAPGDGVFYGEGPPMRTMAAAFPSSFDSLVDLSLLETPAEEGSLDGSSKPLTTALLDGAPVRMVGVWSARSSSIDDDRAVFESAGYQQTNSWSGPQTVVITWQQP